MPLSKKVNTELASVFEQRLKNGYWKMLPFGTNNLYF